MRIHQASIATFVALSCFASRAHAQADYAHSEAGREDASSPALITDVRVGLLARSNSGYFDHASTFGFPVSRTALGLRLDAGAEVLPRLSLIGSVSYYGEGATREQYAKLMVTSESLLLHARYAVLRWQSSLLLGQIEASIGGGRYWIKETYSDSLTSSRSLVSDGSSYGFALGLDASIHVGPFRTVLGYAYHYAPASIGDRIGGVVQAGGHEFTLGFGIRL